MTETLRVLEEVGRLQAIVNTIRMRACPMTLYRVGYKLTHRGDDGPSCPIATSKQLHLLRSCRHSWRDRHNNYHNDHYNRDTTRPNDPRTKYRATTSTRPRYRPG